MIGVILAEAPKLGPIQPIGVLLFIVNILFVCGVLLLLGFGMIKLLRLLSRHSKKLRRLQKKQK